MIIDYSKKNIEVKDNIETKKEEFIIIAFYEAYKKLVNIYKENLDSIDSCEELHKIINIFFKLKKRLDNGANLKKELDKFPFVESLIINEMLLKFDHDFFLEGHKVKDLIIENNKKIEEGFKKINNNKDLVSF